METYPKPQEFVMFTGATGLALIGIELKYPTKIGSWTDPAIATVPISDADLFEEILKEYSIAYYRHP